MTHSSKRITHDAVLVLISLAALAAVTLAMAEDKASASLELRASVPVNCTVDIAQTSKSSSLDLRAGEQDAVVGVVTENCNSRNGYTVTISSGGVSQLRSASASGAPAPYSFRYDGVAVGSNQQIVVNRDQASFGRQRQLMVSIPANATAVAGDYAANLSLVIAAK